MLMALFSAMDLKCHSSLRQKRNAVFELKHADDELLCLGENRSDCLKTNDEQKECVRKSSARLLGESSAHGSHDFVTSSDLTLQIVANLKWPT